MLRCYDGFVVNNNEILHYVVLCYFFITDKERSKHLHNHHKNKLCG